MNAEVLWEYDEWKSARDDRTPEKFLAERENRLLANRARYALAVGVPGTWCDILKGVYDDEVAEYFEEAGRTEAGTVARVTGE